MIDIDYLHKKIRINGENNAKLLVILSKVLKRETTAFS